MLSVFYILFLKSELKFKNFCSLKLDTIILVLHDEKNPLKQKIMPLTFQKRRLTMSSVTGNYDVNKQM